jgi:hypothetical protein
MSAGPSALWWGVIAIGVYHGLNPAMGWPLAVANGLTEKRGAAVFATLVPLGAGHLLAMAVVLVPFALLAWMLQWSRELRIAAGALVLLFGLVKLLRRRHPSWLVRIRPTQLVLWSFLMATAHGAALMLLPLMMGLCEPAAAVAPAAIAADTVDAFGHRELMAVMADLLRSSVATAVAVSLVHTLAMIGSGGVAAWGVYRVLGLRFLKRSWFNLDGVWALSLMAAGAAALATALVAAR